MISAIYNFMEIQEQFNRRLAACELVLYYIQNNLVALSMLDETLKFDHSVISSTKLALNHYIINNLVSLFDNNSTDVFSLPRLSTQYTKQFPHGFFDEYNEELAKFKTKFEKDIKRLEKNRHLSSAHFGAKEELGWKPGAAKRMDDLFGTESPIAHKEELEFITPLNIKNIPLVQNLNALAGIVQDLRIKYMTQQAPA